MSTIKELLKEKNLLVIDGSFASELEKGGLNLCDSLWSAKALYENQKLVKKVHENYFESGADIVITGSYQAHIQGFLNKGFTHEKAIELLKLSVKLAKAAKEKYLTKNKGRKLAVAASVGPYGAYLADGSEYKGNYKLKVKELEEFHEEKFCVLASEQPDFFAFETIPSIDEAQAYVNLLKKYENISGWFTFSCKDEKHICEGVEIKECVKLIDKIPQVEAVGVNCTRPEYIESLIKEIKKATDKAVAVYPNTGENYDPKTKTWSGSPVDFTKYAKKWYESGAKLIGGCCRTSPKEIKEIYEFSKTLTLQK